MDQEIWSHPVLTNYEVSRNGVVTNRRLKKPVGWVNKMGYLMFTTAEGNRSNLINRIVYEQYNGPFRDGFVIDYIDSFPQNNKLSNLEAISQSQIANREMFKVCKAC